MDLMTGKKITQEVAQRYRKASKKEKVWTQGDIEDIREKLADSQASKPRSEAR